ncbi:keratin, type I cytoskeletal 13-like isoform X2 [Tachysurus ichikawai]
MQNLNDRMEVFIKKVQTLNSSNAELQRKTDERSASRTVESCDYSETELSFRKTVEMDIAFSRKYMDEITLTRSTLEILLQNTHKKMSALEKTFTEQNDDLMNMTKEVRRLKTPFHKLQIERKSEESVV